MIHSMSGREELVFEIVLGQADTHCLTLSI